MQDFNQQPWWAQTLIILLIGGGCLALWQSAADFLPQQQATEMRPQEVREAFRQADAIDRANWKAMWEKAGKQPPELPPSSANGHP